MVLRGKQRHFGQIEEKGKEFEFWLYQAPAWAVVFDQQIEKDDLNNHTSRIRERTWHMSTDWF